MSKSRRKAGGATAGRYKPKNMGKGYAADRPKLGFRPPQPNVATGAEGSAAPASRPEPNASSGADDASDQ